MTLPETMNMFDELNKRFDRMRGKFLEDIQTKDFNNIPKGINKINEFLSEKNLQVICGYNFRIYKEHYGYTLRCYSTIAPDVEIEGDNPAELCKIACRYYYMNNFILD